MRMRSFPAMWMMRIFRQAMSRLHSWQDSLTDVCTIIFRRGLLWACTRSTTGTDMLRPLACILLGLKIRFYLHDYV